MSAAVESADAATAPRACDVLCPASGILQVEDYLVGWDECGCIGESAYMFYQGAHSYCMLSVRGQGLKTEYLFLRHVKLCRMAQLAAA